jgi:hypothetical protein
MRRVPIGAIGGGSAAALRSPEASRFFSGRFPTGDFRGRVAAVFFAQAAQAIREDRKIADLLHKSHSVDLRAAKRKQITEEPAGKYFSAAVTAPCHRQLLFWLATVAAVNG